MKRILLCGLLTSLFLTGCMDFNLKLKINQNWAGDFEIRLEMLDQMFQMMQAQMSAQGGTDVSAFLDKETLSQKVAENGGKLKSFSNTVENGMRKIGMEVWVPDAKKAMSLMGGGQMQLKQEGDSWSWEFMDNGMAETMKQSGQEAMEQQLSMIAPTLTGMKWTIDIQVPELVDTNLKKVDAKTASYSIDYDRDIAGKEGKELVDAFMGMLERKWVQFKGVK